MTKAPDKGNRLEPEDRSRQIKQRWRRILWWAIAILLTSGGGGLAYGWYWLQQKLVPLIETELTDYLNRPIDIGELESVSPGGVKFGKSEIPATETDPDRVIAEAVKVNIQPWSLLQSRLNLDVTIIEPDVYIEQDQEKRWVNLDFGDDEDQETEGFKVELNSLRFRDADVVLAAADEQGLRPPVALELSRAIARFLEEGERIEFDLQGEVVEGGKVRVQGEGIPDTGAIDVSVRGTNLKPEEITNLLALPINLTGGEADGDIKAEIRDDQPVQIYGTGELDGVTVDIPGLVQPYSDSTGRLIFEGTEIGFDRVKTNFGQVSGIVEGSIDTEGDYDVIATTDPIEITAVLDSLELDRPTFPLVGKVEGLIDVSGPLDDPTIAFDIVTTTPSRVDRLNLDQAQTQLVLEDDDLQVRSFEATPTTGGKITADGVIGLEEGGSVNLDVQANRVDGDAIAEIYQIDLPVDPNQVDGVAQIVAPTANPSDFSFVDGEANFALGGGRVTIDQIRYDDGDWQAQLIPDNVILSSLPIDPETLEAVQQGRLSGSFALAGSNNSWELDQIDATGVAEIQLAGGTATTDNFQLSEGDWRGDIVAEGIDLGILLPDVPPNLQGIVAADFAARGNVQQLGLDDIIATGSGVMPLDDGIIEANNVRLEDGQWRSDLVATDVRLERFYPDVQDHLNGLVDGTFQATGNVDNFNLDAVDGTGSGNLAIAAGNIQATSIELDQGDFVAVLVPQSTDLPLLLDQPADNDYISGNLGGEVTVTGDVNTISPTTINAQGQLYFSEGIALIDRPLTTQVNWDGRRVEVLEAEAQGLAATGFIDLDPSFFVREDKFAGVDRYDFQVAQADNINLERLTIPLSPQVAEFVQAENLGQLTDGTGDFTGRIAGTPTEIDIDGDLVVYNLEFDDRFDFEPVMTGSVVIDPDRGVDLNLAGVEDNLNVSLTPDYAPEAFTINWNDSLLVGEAVEGNLLEVEVEDLPVSSLKAFALKRNFPVVQPVANQQVEGSLSGDFIFDLETAAFRGNNVVVTNPVIGNFTGEVFTGEFQYDQTRFALADAVWQDGISSYLLDGVVTQTPEGQAIQGDLEVEQGQIEDVLATLQIFELQDLINPLGDKAFGSAADLLESPAENTSISVGNPEASILEQLRQLSQIEAMLREQQQQREEQSILPKLAQLNGIFSGKITVDTSPQTGMSAEFDFIGDDWRWGSLTADTVVAQGDFQNGIFTIRPLRVESDNSLIAFSGSFGGETQLGQLRLVDVPVAVFEPFIDGPPGINVRGSINAQATIGGNQANPSAKGELEIVDATINDTSIQSTQGSFSYNNARLNFFASSTINTDDPLTLTGSVPYQLPFATVAPEDYSLNLNVNLEDEGLSIVNILSRNQVNWVDGSGRVSLDVSGNFNPDSVTPTDLVAEGIIEIDDATIAANVLPEDPLTDVNGRILFNFDRIEVESLQGNFSGGDVVISGTLPLENPDSSQSPLTVNFHDLAFDLEGVYQGGIGGNIILTGTAIEPVVGGQLNLFNGDIFLSSANNQDNTGFAANTNPVGIVALTEFEGLRVNLSEDIRIIQPPVLDVVATGSLDVYGSLADPQLEGTIDLERGTVNLFTSQLNIANGDNTARFSPGNGFDPYLDVRLVGSAIETTRTPITVDPLSADVADPYISLGGLQTVRIEARVEGLASQLNNSIELTSSPPRTQTEIIALLGGSYVNTLNDNSTVGLANIAGTALFGTFNTAITEAVGLSEFRLFPIQIIDAEQQQETILGLAAEAGINFTDDLSFSALKILNTQIPANFGLRYHLNENMTIRGSTNLDDDTRIIFEFQQRF